MQTKTKEYKELKNYLFIRDFTNINKEAMMQSWWLFLNIAASISAFSVL